MMKSLNFVIPAEAGIKSAMRSPQNGRIVSPLSITSSAPVI